MLASLCVKIIWKHNTNLEKKNVLLTVRVCEITVIG